MDAVKTCGNRKCENVIVGRAASALYCSTRCSEREAFHRWSEKNPGKSAKRAVRSHKTKLKKERDVLGAIMAGNLDLEGVKVSLARFGKKVEPKRHGIFGCSVCGHAFFIESGQGFRADLGLKCPRCRRSPKNGAAHLRWKSDYCVRCGIRPEDACVLEVDHIDNNHKNNEVGNHQTLCSNCHKLKHGAPHIFYLIPDQLPPGFTSSHRLPEYNVGKWGVVRSAKTGEVVGSTQKRYAQLRPSA